MAHPPSKRLAPEPECDLLENNTGPSERQETTLAADGQRGRDRSLADAEWKRDMVFAHRQAEASCSHAALSSPRRGRKLIHVQRGVRRRSRTLDSSCTRTSRKTGV